MNQTPRNNSVPTWLVVTLAVFLFVGGGTCVSCVACGVGCAACLPDSHEGAQEPLPTSPSSTAQEATPCDLSRAALSQQQANDTHQVVIDERCTATYPPGGEVPFVHLPRPDGSCLEHAAYLTTAEAVPGPCKRPAPHVCEIHATEGGTVIGRLIRYADSEPAELAAQCSDVRDALMRQLAGPPAAPQQVPSAAQPVWVHAQANPSAACLEELTNEPGGRLPGRCPTQGEVNRCSAHTPEFTGALVFYRDEPRSLMLSGCQEFGVTLDH